MLRTVMLSMALAVGCLTSWAADKQPTRGVIRVKLQPEMALKRGAGPAHAGHGHDVYGHSPSDRAAKAVKCDADAPHGALCTQV